MVESGEFKQPRPEGIGQRGGLLTVSHLPIGKYIYERFTRRQEYPQRLPNSTIWVGVPAENDFTLEATIESAPAIFRGKYFDWTLARKGEVQGETAAHIVRLMEFPRRDRDEFPIIFESKYTVPWDEFIDQHQDETYEIWLPARGADRHSEKALETTRDFPKWAHTYPEKGDMDVYQYFKSCTEEIEKGAFPGFMGLSRTTSFMPWK